MKVSLKTFMPAMAASLIVLSSCSDVNKRAQKYMEDKPFSEYAKLTSTPNSEEVQSRLDSMAYRDLFEGYKASKDSAKMAEFNKIAARMRANSSGNNTDKCISIRQNLIKNGISVKDYNNINSQVYQCNQYSLNRLQHLADDWAYRKFFQEIGIMNDELSKKCDEVSSQVIASYKL